MTEELLKRIHEDSKAAAEKRHALDIQKAVFVATLLGIGSLKTEQIVSTYRVLYIAPLVAVFYDVMVMGQHFLIKRNGAFIRTTFPETEEGAYHKFLAMNRDRFFRLGSRGFSVLAIAAALALLYSAKRTLEWYDLVWFGTLVCGYGFVMQWSLRLHARMDNMQSKKEDS